MTVSLVLACLWAVVASAIGMMPRRVHWPAAYGLIVVGIPLVGFVTLENGPFWGLLALAAGVSVLCWPVLYLGRWVARRGRGAGGE